MAMLVSFPHRDTPLVGLAYNKYVPALIAEAPEAIDYVEIPFELLSHDPSVAMIAEKLPVVLHCATLSIAGSVPCPRDSIGQISSWVNRTATPWLGEHLAFITAEREEAGKHPDPYAPGEPYNIGYTVSPPMTLETVDRVAANVARYRKEIGVPILLENSPLYFRIPSSTMAQTEFIRAVCDRSEAGFLLDLAHFYITSQTMGFDAEREIEQLPLDRVVEVHISGVDEQTIGSWDNHAARAPEAVFRLFEQVLEHATPRAVTLEYNWSSVFPRAILLEELARTRETIGEALRQ
jgi:uncharacterized protein (UPF0276 family)